MALDSNGQTALAAHHHWFCSRQAMGSCSSSSDESCQKGSCSASETTNCSADSPVLPLSDCEGATNALQDTQQATESPQRSTTDGPADRPTIKSTGDLTAGSKAFCRLVEAIKPEFTPIDPARVPEMVLASYPGTTGCNASSALRGSICAQRLRACAGSETSAPSPR